MLSSIAGIRPLQIALDQASILAVSASRVIATSSSSRACAAAGSFCLSRVSLRWQAARSCGTPQ
ncbi:hypothetical protein D3C84_922500 [compost metagenome]